MHFQPVDSNIWNFQLEVNFFDILMTRLSYPLNIQDVVNSVPPHWREGTIEEQGNRWAGQVGCGLKICFDLFLFDFLQW
jgi:hypothetical protein